MAKKKIKLSLAELIRRCKNAGISEDIHLKQQTSIDPLGSLEERIKNIETMLRKDYHSGEKPYFLMYDIEDNKVRRQIAKYLKTKGFVRIQKSVYLAWLPTKIHNEVSQDLKEINSYYENADSIIIIPAMAEILQRTLLIGKEVEFQMDVANAHTIII